MKGVVDACRDLLDRAERGEVEGVAFTASIKGGPRWTCVAGDTGGRLIQMIDGRTGDKETVAHAG